MRYSSLLVWLVGSATALTAPAYAQSGTDNDVESRLRRLEQDNEELKLKLDSVTSELEQFEFGDVFTEVGESEFGMGPAASKVYQTKHRFSIGGYGEGFYRHINSGDGKDSTDFLRAVLYFGYKFNEKWVFNSEIEWEHAGSGGGGSSSVEFAYLENLYDEALNFRAGLLLTPMGFINEMHEPTTFYGPSRPEVEKRIIPTTWRENGAGIHGDLGDVSYKFFIINGLEGEKFTASGLRGGRQKGSRAVAEDLAAVLRVDWNISPGFVAGISAYHGNSGQNADGLDDISTTIADAHVEARYRGLRVRGLYTMAFLDDTESIFDTTGEVVGEEMVGFYVEAGYDLMELTDSAASDQVIPFLRYEALDTHADVASGFSADPEQDETIWTAGIQWLPTDQIVFKAALQNFDRGDDRIELGMGYVF